MDVKYNTKPVSTMLISLTFNKQLFLLLLAYLHQLYTLYGQTVNQKECRRAQSWSYLNDQQLSEETV
jgi:hypothetical protein